ncbi:MAG: ZIP family metal transporter [Gemmatimonadota bacterium]|nr:MAG: ZIP family metal transporter [Gemmatimonadota bacterium]
MILVFIYGSLTALATGIGALPFLFVRTISPRGVAYANAIASGLMLGACFGLLLEGTESGTWGTIIGANLGVLFILATQRILEHHNVHFGSIGRGGSRRTLLMIVVMTVHSFSEGVAVGTSFGGGMSLAVLITASIAVHNIPEGLAISAVLRPQGVSVAGCAGWSIFSSLPQPLMAVPAYLLVDTFTTFLPYGIGFAAGAMVLMVFLELLPEAYQRARKPRVALLVSISLAGMIVFQRFL